MKENKVTILTLFIPCILNKSFIHNTNEYTFDIKKSYIDPACFGVMYPIFT
jgi:hypothetical protein